MRKDTKQTTITYELADGRNVRVDVSHEVKEIIDDTQRALNNLKRKERGYDVLLYSNAYIDSTFTDFDGDTSDLLCKAEARAKLVSALSSLPEKQKRRLELFFLHDLTCKEIAVREKVSVSAVHKSIASALYQMKTLMKR